MDDVAAYLVPFLLTNAGKESFVSLQKGTDTENLKESDKQMASNLQIIKLVYKATRANIVVVVVGYIMVRYFIK